MNRFAWDDAWDDPGALNWSIYALAWNSAWDDSWDDLVVS